MFTLSKFVDSSQTVLTPTDPDLERVNKIALEPLAPEQVWTGRCHAANDRYDRTHERFPVEYLERIAATAPGKAVLGGHDTKSLPLARIYDARVEKDERGHHVSADYFVNLGTQRGRDLVSDIKAGVLKDVSVTIRPGPRLCDLCGKSSVNSAMGILPGCEHWPGMEYEGKEATATYCPKGAGRVETYEISLVYCGAQYGAETAAKGLWTPETITYPGPTTGGASNYTVRFIPYYGGDDEVAGRIPVQIAAAPAASGGAMFDTLEKALAEIDRLQGLPLAAEREAELTKQITEMRPLSELAQKARDWHFTEIRRLAGILERSAATEAILQHLTHSDWDTLESIRKEMAAEVAKKLGPVDPQGSTDGPPPDDDTDREKRPRRTPFGRLVGG